MNFVPTIAAVLLPLAAIVTPPAHAQDHHGHHGHHAPAAAMSQESPAQRYATDAPLRKGMAQIRAAVDALGPYERGHMGAEQAVTFATGVQEQVAYLIANCKLEPQADAALHGIIAPLVAGARTLKTDPTDPAAIPPMREALAAYRTTFDDPGFDLEATGN